MTDNDEYSVTVSAANSASEHLVARSITLAASGTLFVDGKRDDKVYVRTFQPGQWESFEVKRVARE